jgi:ubiquinone/menaquinone biosynthesis C-methylase UbiE
MSSYVFDQAWKKERQRLQAIEYLYDGSTIRRLTELGVSEGWRCLEVGCGAGGVTLWMADQVASTGQVVATDLDTRFLDGHGRGNLDVRATTS